MWLAIEPVDMRAGADRLLARAVRHARRILLGALIQMEPSRRRRQWSLRSATAPIVSASQAQPSR